MAEPGSICIVKLGGSLLDLPDIVSRVLSAISQFAQTEQVLLIVGGGRAADVVRDLDQQLQLGEEVSHWLAIRAMAINAHAFAQADARFELVADRLAAAHAWQQRSIAVMAPFDWLDREASAGIDIPHRWSFTSDSIAAHVATQMSASRLIVIKSTLGSLSGAATTMDACTAAGLIDDEFAAASRDLPEVLLVNLRDSPMSCCSIRSRTDVVPSRRAAL